MDKIQKSLKNWWKDAWNKGRLLSLIPYFLIAIVFIIVPVIILITKALNSPGTTQYPFDQFMEIKDSETWAVMFRSVGLGLLAAFFALLIAFPFAYIIARSKSRTFRISSIMLMLSPLTMFTVAKVFALRGLLLKMTGGDADKLNNYFVMVVGMIFLYLPFMVLPLFSVLQQMPNSLLEASEDLGYNKFWTILKVVVPYSMKAIFSSLAIVFMLSATTLVINENLLGGSEHNKLIGNMLDIQSQFMLENKYSLSLGSVLALTTILVMISIYALIYFAPVIISKIRGGLNV